MSGHSKWATTKRQKFATDAKRGAAFTKLANMITVAAREGGDPEFNFKLRLAVDKAKQAAMPKDNIDRAIVRGTGKGEGANLVEEIIYEAYGPGGAALVITAVTDNRLRAYTDIRTAVTKHGGRLADEGSVTYQFKQSGVLYIEHTTDQTENLQLALLDLPIDDFETVDQTTRVLTSPRDLQIIRQNIERLGFTIVDAKLEWIPKIVLRLDKENALKLQSLLEQLDNLDDVSEVNTNTEDTE